jgi:hypothetical protein
MRTWLVLAAVLAVAAAALADALRGSIGGNARPSAETAVRRIVPPGVPAGFMGTVYYSDPRDGCRLHTLRLAGFRDGKPPVFRSCRFSLSPDAQSATPDGSAWSPLGSMVAVPRGGEFVLQSSGSDETVLVRGTSPTFKPDGTLTYLRAGKLVEWTTHCDPGERRFTPPGISATVRCAHLLYPQPLASVAWLSEARFAALTRSGEALLVENGSVLVRARLPAHRTARLSVSPRGDFVSIWLDGRLAGTFDSGGGPVAMPPIQHVRALAWSPTERWALLATDGGSVYIFRPNTGDARVRRLGIQARDVAWRN